MIDFITALWLGFLGACVGSFLNVVAYRMPRGLSVVWQPSHCPNCQRPIRPYDNVPILGWLWLRGRCRDCRAPISPRYAIVETVMGAVFFLLAYVEVFTGGANLPDGPITELRGAWQTVWNPYWPLLATYGVHVLLFTLLTPVVLFDLDDERTPSMYVTIATTLVLAAAIAAPAAWHATTFGATKVAGDVASALAAACLGALPGAAITLAAASRVKAPIVRQAQPVLYNAGFALLLSGAVLGWRASPVMFGAMAIVLLLNRARGVRWPLVRGALPGACWVAALTLLVAGRRVFDAF